MNEYIAEKEKLGKETYTIISSGVDDASAVNELRYLIRHLIIVRVKEAPHDRQGEVEH